MNERRPSVCLNMIVRNEAHVIRRCLDSARPLFDTWLIVDTGSTDDTTAIIRDHLRDVPGELIERPWVDFAHNRTEALGFASPRADYLLFIDADEVFELEDGFTFPPLSADSYTVEVVYGGYTYRRRQLVRTDLPWRYYGVLHEYVHCDEARTEEPLLGIRTIPRHDGARARGANTYRRDALLLEQALLDAPEDPRTVFYLAQSYRDAGDLELALRNYRRRVDMGGWVEEVWFSLYQIAQIEERLEKPWPDVQQAYLAAYQFRPERAEPLFRVAVHYQSGREFALSYLFLSRAMAVPLPATDALFVERAVYEYLVPVEYAVAAFYVGDHAGAIETDNALLASGRLPPHAVDQVVRNRRFSLAALHPGGPPAPEGRVRVVVPLQGCGAEVDELIESLLLQEDVDFDVTLLGEEGSSAPPRVPEHPRLRFAVTPSGGWDSTVGRFVAADCEPSDIVVPIAPRFRLASSAALADFASAFRDAGCLLVSTPYRLPDGRLSSWDAAASDKSFNASSPASAADATRGFRASLWFEARTAARTDAVTPGSLWRKAGFHGVRFLDEPLAVMSAPPPPCAGAARFRRRAAVADGRPSAERPLPPALAALEEVPLISCLMVTKDRLALAKRSIRCFAEQTYPRLELVVVSEGDDWYRSALQRHVDEHAIEHVRFVKAEPGVPLGRLRNISLDAAAGDIVCQWDDDDCNHPDRILCQAERLIARRCAACFLTDHLQFLEHERMLFWIDWTMGGRITDERQLFPGTLMMFKDERFQYPETGPYARQGEDSVMIADLYRNVPVTKLSGMGHLYLYDFHGRNTFSREHHYRITSCTAPNEVVQRHAAEIREAVRYYPIPKPIVAYGAAGPVFGIA